MIECHPSASYTSWHDYVIHQLKSGQISGLKTGIEKDMNRSEVIVIPIVIGALGTISKYFHRWLCRTALKVLEIVSLVFSSSFRKGFSVKNHFEQSIKGDYACTNESRQPFSSSSSSVNLA